MWKWLILILIIVAALLLGAPYGMGIMAEKRINQLAADASKTPNMKVAIMDYNRGWFKSRAQIEVTITVPNRRGSGNAAAQPATRTLRFSINESILHGPIIFKNGIKLGQGFVQSDVELTPQQKQMLEMMFNVQGPTPHATVSMLITLGGSVTTNINVPAFTLVAKGKQGTIKWSGLNGYWNVASDLKQIDGRLTMQGADIDMQQGQVQMGEMDLRYNEKEDSQGVWVGDVNFDFPNINIARNGETIFKLDGMKITSASSINTQKLLDTTLNIDIAKLVVNGASYGPATYQSSLKNLDTQVLLKIQKQAQSADDANLSPQQQRLMMMSLLPLLPEVFNKGAIYELEKLSVTLPEGVINANGQIKMPNSKPGEKMSMAELYKAIEADFNFEVPVTIAQKVMAQMMARDLTKRQQLRDSVAKQLQQQGADTNNAALQPMDAQQIQQQAVQNANQQLQQWVNNGMLKQQDNQYTMTAVLKDGQLMVNGKSVFGGTAANQPSMGPGSAMPNTNNQATPQADDTSSPATTSGDSDQSDQSTAVNQ